MELTLAHWTYLAGVVVIIATMAFRKNVVVPAVAFTFLTALAYTADVVDALASIFQASMTAAAELFNIFLIIALITALLGALRAIGSDRLMIRPFRKVMRTGNVSFWVLAAVTFVVSLFFWPTPAVPLVGAILLPVAIRAGLKPLHAGVAIAIAGQGMALAADYVIQVAPGISAQAAGGGVTTGEVADKALVLSCITGVVALTIAWFRSRSSTVAPDPALLEAWESVAGPAEPEGDAVVEEVAAGEEVAEGTVTHDAERVPVMAGNVGGGTSATASSPHGADPGALDDYAQDPPRRGDDEADAVFDGMCAHDQRCGRAFAVIVPLAFLGVVSFMLFAKFSDAVPDLEGGDAAALVGGVATLLLVVAALASRGREALEEVSDHVIDGFVFAFRAMGVVIPIAGFFFIGNAEFAASIMGLGEDADPPSLLFELVERGYEGIPEVGALTAFGMLLVGMLTGLDGSGFSGLPLTGSLSGAFGPQAGIEASTLAAIGQVGAVYVGGGTLIAWSSLVAVAGFARVSVVELARQCFVPVVVGLLVSTTFAIVVFG